MPQRKYRILHVIDSFDLGGAQEALVNLVACRDREKFDAEVACMHRPGVYTETFRQLGIPVYSLSPHKFFPLYLLKLAWLMATRPYDVVHCHLIASNLIAKPIAALFGVKVRFNHDQTNDEYRYKNKIRLFLDALTNRLSTHICAVSKSTRDFLVEYEKVSPEKVSLVYNAIDLKRFTPKPSQHVEARTAWKLPLNRIIIGAIGRLNYQKNFSLFLEVAKEIHAEFPNTFFVIAGSGPEEKMLKEKTRNLGMEDHVCFLGYVGKMETLYPALDMLVMTSRFEGLPMTLLEAMAMGVPAVASKLDGIAEIIEDGVDGRLVTPGDKAQFVKTISEMLIQQGQTQRIAQAAREKVNAQFSAERMTRETEALYLHYLEPA